MSIHMKGCHVYAVDIHRSLGLIRELMKNASSIMFFQADLLNLPFNDEYFDIAWCSGVVMATPNASQAFGSIARKVKPGGRFFVSVYGKDLHHYGYSGIFFPFLVTYRPSQTTL